MILTALHRLAIAEGLVEDPDYELKPITYLVRINRQGRFIGPIQSTREAPPAVGKKKPKAVPRQFLMPREPARTSGAYAFLLFDKADYLFGREPEVGQSKPKSSDQLRSRQDLFREKIRLCAEKTQDPGASAALSFLADLQSGVQAVDLPADCTLNDLFALVYELDELPIAARPAIRAYWRESREASKAGADAIRCLVTGQIGPLAEKHTMLKGVPGAVSSGAPLVSFNASAFESYGWKSNANAPVSVEAAEGYGTALQRLVSTNPVDPNNPDRHLPRLNVRTGGNALVCFWSPPSPFASELALQFNFGDERNPNEVQALYQSVWKGEPHEIADPTAFYALVLSGSQGRVAARGWLESTVAKTAGHVAQHFRDLEIVRNTPRPKDRELQKWLPMPALLESLSGIGKNDGVPPQMAEQFTLAALRGTEYPLGFLQRALLRQRAEIGRSEWSDFVRRDARASLIKAVLNRRRRLVPSLHLPEVLPMLDPENADPGYICGRLMAILENIQRLALGDVNASVVDRFFGAASATPAAVFPRLMRNARNHIRKALDDPKNAGLARRSDRLLDQTIGQLSAEDSFPSWLNLEQQGLFAIGYHHQRQALFTKKEASAEEARDAAAQSNSDNDSNS